MTTRKVNGTKVDEKSDKPASDGKIEAPWLHLKLAAVAKATDAEFPEAPVYWLALRFSDGRVVLLRSDASSPNPAAIRMPESPPETQRPFTLTKAEREVIKLSVDAYADLNAGLATVEAATKARTARGKGGGK